ncbi:AMP-binding protein, partial [Plantactinospora sp. GCM10030261]|uniref:AMP-binding protein n=1 Tax=Plantactinospora sp. GCM10030261 TaxID=3273420 RepID=UPI00361FA4AE
MLADRATSAANPSTFLGATDPRRVAIRFLTGTAVTELSYGTLNDRVDRLATGLATAYDRGSRVQLLLPAGPDLVVAFLACLRAGMVAVPVPLPASGRLTRAGDRIAAVARDCAPALALVAGGVDPAGTLPPEVAVSTADDLLAGGSDTPPPPLPAGADLAFLQYSSGSTGAPKAVCNTHAAIRAQVAMLAAMLPDDEPVRVVGWLPLYHDMGMLQQLLLPVFTGGTTTMMSPAAFAADPARWLRAASSYRATWIAGPDFGYRRCADAMTDDEVAGLDLRTIRYAANGAEPVRESTLTRFVARFAPAGLRREAMTPSYGLAEAVLCVSSSHRPRGWRSAAYDPGPLTEGVARRRDDGGGRVLVSSGNWFHDRQVSIVDPNTRAELPTGHVGEIWVSGPGLPAGYWRQPELSARTFGAMTADGRGPWLRTGDLGFLDDGELFVCGRLRDLIILGGANHHPDDIERTLERHVDAVAVGGACAVQPDDDPAVTVFAEVDRHLDETALAEIAGDIRQQVYEHHEVPLDEVVLVRRSGLPRTTSGKIRRGATATGHRAGRLPVLHADRVNRVAPTTDSTPTLPAVHDTLANVLGRDRLALDASFADLGLDSVRATEWVGALSKALHRPVPVSLVFRHPTPRRFAAALDAPTAPPTTPPAAAHTTDRAVAVIGVGLRLAGGIQDLDGLAALLRAGGSTVRQPPDQRARDGVPLTLPGGYLDAIDTFDAGFFGIPAASAAAIDPQQRLMLEVAWHAVEDAGMPAHRLRGARIGVFVGQGHHDYSTLPLRLGRPDLIGAFSATGASMSATAGRIAYHFGFRGPAQTIDTACSASLVAVDTAVRHLTDGTCEMALAGGVGLALSPDTERALLDAGMLSASGRCATLDADADGYGRGEGAALLVLKPLAAAQRDGDRVLAVIRGSAVAHDGASSSLTAPEPGAQADVIRAALTAAGLRPGDIDAVELHGTGTPLGDPVEVSALADVFTGRRSPLLLGSVKTNLGHLEAAAGVAGLLRALVALREQIWPGSPTWNAPNPHLDGVPLDYRFPARTHHAPVRRVGVSSFGFTGTVAHVVLEAAPDPATTRTTAVRTGDAATGTGAGTPTPAPPWNGWVPVAGADVHAVRRRARLLADALSELDEPAQARLLAAWRQRRDHLQPRRAVVHADTPESLRRALRYPLTPGPAGTTGPLVLRLDAAAPLAELVAAMATWVGGIGTEHRSDVIRLLAQLTRLGLRPDLIMADPGEREAIARHLGAPGLPPVVDDVPPGLVMTVGAGTPAPADTVLLDVTDGGRSGVIEAYRRGADIDWSVLDPPVGHEPLLPRYPFARRRHWYPVDGNPARLDGTRDGPLTAERIRADVNELLSRSGPDGVRDDADLVAAGLDSVGIMGLVARWRRAGAEVSFADLLSRPTLAAWSTRLLTPPDEPPTTALPAVDEDAWFDLTPVQRAYLVGRDPEQPLGGVGCHLYAELDGHGLDVARLDRAARALVARHGMLRAEFDPGGRQRVRDTSPWPGVTVHDLRDSPAERTAAELTAIRTRLSHRLLDVSTAEVFDLTVSLLPDGAHRLHLNLDLLVADALSIQLLMSDLASLYLRPEVDLPPIGLTFAGYLTARRGRPERIDRDREHWRQRLPDLPGPPRLPMVEPATTQTPRFTRRSGRVNPEAWQAIVARAREHAVTPSVALATAYCLVLGQWSVERRFLLNLTLFDREELHPDVARLVADFTNMVLLDVDTASATGSAASFAATARAVQDRLRESLAHSGYSGVEVLRDLARQRGPHAATAPVVFTSNLGRDLVDPDVREAFGRRGATVSQTPQVWLDHQVTQEAGGVDLAWDAVEGLFRAGVLDDMFHAYQHLVHWLAHTDWTQPPPPLTPTTHLAIRAAVNNTTAPISGHLLHQQFFHHAQHQPHHPAIVGPDGTRTYLHLAHQALTIAGWLTHHHLQPGDTVAITLPKGPDQIAAVLGTLAAGGTYVPINPNQPEHRRHTITTTADIHHTLDHHTITTALHHPHPLPEPI